MIMGILNLTPDSFSQDGLLSTSKEPADILKLAEQLAEAGCDILDVGGESTRPGARRISVAEEIQRVVPTIKMLAKTFKIPISVDTYKAKVAEQALDAGASIVNNIMGA